MSHKAIVVDRTEDGATRAAVQVLSDDQLPDGNVTIAVEYSTLNYKDGLCLGPGGGLVRNYPHVPGIDFSGTVETSEDPRYRPGDQVILTGWRVGETRWGGYATRTRIDGNLLVPLPDGMTTRDAMAIGTAGFTAALAVSVLENHGLTPDDGNVLVTGASGGVGSISTLFLASLGYQIAAVTGRPESTDYLKSLGASLIVPREDLNETTQRPLEKEMWGACIDSVGSKTLARILGQMKYGSSVAAVGLAGGADLPASVIPFLLRGVNLLGIDSVMCSHETRMKVWNRLAKEFPLDRLADLSRTVALDELPDLGRMILKGQIKGRLVVDVNS